MAVGVLLFAAGLWIVLRTVRGQRRLPDLLLGAGTDGSTAAAAPASTPRAARPTTAGDAGPAAIAAARRNPQSGPLRG